MSRFGRFVDSFGIGLIFLLLCVFFWLQSDIFLTRSNCSIVLIQTAVNIIIAVGMTFVISAAEIDLSVGSLFAVCGMVTAFVLKVDPETGTNVPMWVANTVVTAAPEGFLLMLLWWTAAGSVFFTLALLPGLAAGSVTGLIVVGLRVPSFIVTLGFMMIYRGLSRYLTNAAPITGMPPRFMVVGAGVWFEVWGFPVPYAAAIALAVFLVGAVLLAWTRFGRSVLATGGNSQAAYLSGTPVGRTRFLVFVVSGACVAIAAILQTSRLFIGDPNAGEGYELNAIAAVIIGGTSLFGGRGTVVGTFFGALIIGVLQNGLDLLDVTDHMKQMVIGSMIIFAVFLDYYRRKLYSAASSS